MAIIPRRHDTEYPESDGQPIAEPDRHRDEMFDLIAALKDRLLGTEQQRLVDLESRGLLVLPRQIDRAAFQGYIYPNRGKLASEMVREDRR